LWNLPCYLFGLEVLHAPETQFDRGIGRIVVQGVADRQLQTRRELAQDAVKVVFIDINLAALGERTLLLAVTLVTHHHQFQRQLNLFLRTAGMQVELDINPGFWHFILKAA
jgi:hypothetical protein